MALHDNPLWILSHIQNSFVVSDDTGNSELVLVDDNKAHLVELAKREGATPFLELKNDEKNVQNGEDGDNDDDALSRSVEIRVGRNPLGYRPRCNTERKLEKLKHDRKKQVNIRTVFWKEASSSADPQDNLSPGSGAGLVDDLFPKKEAEQKVVKILKKSSLLSRKIDTEPAPIVNPFTDFSQFDTIDQSGSAATDHRINIRVYLSALQEDTTKEDDENESESDSTSNKNSPTAFITGQVHPSTLVKDVIGYICWKYVKQERDPPLKTSNLETFSLYLAEPDGSIEWDLRAIEKLEPISKFGFSDYALVNLEHHGHHQDALISSSLDVKVTLPDGTYTVLQLPNRDITAKCLVDKVMSRHKQVIQTRSSGVTYSFNLEAKSIPDKPLEPTQTLHTVEDTEFFIVRENSRRCAEFEPETDHLGPKFLEFYAMDATTYQEYRDVWFVTKIRSKLAVVLAISQDRFDIIPHQTPSGRIWAATLNIPNGGTFDMDSIVACEVINNSDNKKSEAEIEPALWTFRIVLEHKINSYKKVYFQATKDVVEEIHSKVSHLLAWHSSQARTNYIVCKELKNRRRRTTIF
jgi:hypothetical protein